MHRCGRWNRQNPVHDAAGVHGIALTILKAFLIDMSTLTGVYRARSFTCLGLVLVAIGWLYQRILFRQAAPPARPVVPSGA
jgi:uncharacterized membrane protein